MHITRHPFWVVLWILLLLGGGGWPAAVRAQAEDHGWDDRFGLATIDYGYVRALAGTGNDLYAGGSFTSAGLIPANNIAHWDGQRWHSLGAGVNGTVWAAALYKGKLYVGGEFTQAGEVAVNGLAVWDGAAWAPLTTGAGVMQDSYKGIVRALAVADDALYIGGDFNNIHGLATFDIARWDGRKLSALGDGVGDLDYTGVLNGYGSVYALAADADGALFVGGDFVAAGNREPLTVNSVARWDADRSRWQALDAGLTKSYGKGEVRALTVAANGDLFAGGQFVAAGAVALSSLARWDGRTWRGVGSGLGSDSSYAYVNALALVGDALYAGGSMTSIGGKTVSGLAVWERGAWSPVGDGLTDSYDGALSLLPGGDGGLWVAGSFTGGGAVLSRNLIRWTGDAWAALGQGVGYSSIPGRVEALTAASGGQVYAGGLFDHVAGQPASNIAMWDGSRWHSLGAGVNGEVRALAAYDSLVYVGGVFSQAGDASASYIAQFDSATGQWSSLDSGVNGYVYALVVAADGTLYAGGEFSAAGSADVSNIALWDGERWSPLGQGLVPDDAVRALAWDGRNLYIGGGFNTVAEGDEDIPANGLVIWDSQTDERYLVGQGDAVGVTVRGSFGDDYAGDVYALALTDQALYVGGAFDKAGGVAAGSVAAFDFQQGWQALGDSVSHTYTPAVNALVAADRTVYVGGEFTAAGRAPGNSIAAWDEVRQQWQGLQGGVSADSPVNALTVADESLYVGGQFITAGDAPAASFARWGAPVTPAKPTPLPRRGALSGGANAAPTPTPCPANAATGGLRGLASPCGKTP